LTTVEVEIVGKGAEIVGVVDAAVRRKHERAVEAEQSNRRAPFDEIWCVVDTERMNDNPSWERGADRATAHEFRLAWSNPCFEYWFLLHFERIGRSFDRYSAVARQLRRHVSHYTKTSDCFDQLAPRTAAAIDHSKQIHRSQWQDTPRPIDRNPATTVHELVEKLIEVGGMTVKQFQERWPVPDSQRPKRRST